MKETLVGADLDKFNTILEKLLILKKAPQPLSNPQLNFALIG